MILPGMLLIAGTGRNSGKTTLACRIIQKFHTSERIIAIKISQHGHKIEPGGRVILHEDHIYITEETDAGTGKDSSRMLAAGADRSFFTVASETNLLRAVQHIIGITGDHAMLVCESGGLRDWVEPRLFLIVSCPDTLYPKPADLDMMDYEHVPVFFDGHNFNFDINRITIHEERWETRQDHDIL